MDIAGALILFCVGMATGVAIFLAGMEYNKQGG
jgi:hypothetical protein